MNIISVRILREFIKKHPPSETPLMRWYKTLQKAEYKTPQEMILDFKGSDYVGNDRVVFNVGHNKYRLIVAFDYDRDVGFIKFIGTHKEYDKVDAKTIEYKKFTKAKYREMNINPIKTERDYDNALVEIEQIWGAQPNTPQGDRLDILLLLVQSFEAKHYPLPELDPIEAIKYEMEEKGLKQADLAKTFGISKSKVSEVLNRKRPLTLNFIKSVHKNLGISAEVLLS